jgi:malate permease and related proteins
MEVFSLLHIYSVIIRLLLLGGLGFILYRRKLLNQEAAQFITDFLIKICVPCLIFTNIISHFQFDTRPSVWQFLILSLVVFSVGIFLGFILVFFRKGKIPKNETLSLLSFQNSGYLPMNLVYFLFFTPFREQMLGYIFIYLLGFNLLMWSIGSFLIFRRREEKFSLRSLLTPPVTATLIALIYRKFLPALEIPQVILSPVKMLGDMSFVLSMIVLGAGLAKAGFTHIRAQTTFNIIAISVIKLVLMPFIFILFLTQFEILGLFGFFVILQVSMPSAASLPIIARWKQADYKFISQAVFFSHVFSLITIPFWINLFQNILRQIGQ